jgi:hypothetical protein
LVDNCHFVRVGQFSSFYQNYFKEILVLVRTSCSNKTDCLKAINFKTFQTCQDGK